MFADYKFGMDEIRNPVDNSKDMMYRTSTTSSHCMRTRENAAPGCRDRREGRQIVINLAVQSYREGKVLYWDEKKWKASDKPVRA